VVQIYLQALQAQSRQDAATVRIGTAEAILAQVQSKEELGTASKLDAARALQQLENERLVQIEAARDCHVLQTLLLKTIGKEQQGTVGIRLEKPEFVLLLENEVQRNARDLRSDLLAEEAKAKVADLERRAVGQQRFPKVTGFADYGLLGAGPDRSIGTYNIGISMTVPLWTGRRIESQVAAAQARTDQTEQQVKKIKLQIQQEIRQAAIELQSARESLQSATKATAAAKEILDLSLLRFESGLATSVDTQIAQSDWATNEDRRIQSEYALLLGQARLAKAGGVLSTASVK
jgi:outer membrane protein TolC